jgi:hypothetical protein
MTVYIWQPFAGFLCDIIAFLYLVFEPGVIGSFDLGLFGIFLPKVVN